MATNIGVDIHKASIPAAPDGASVPYATADDRGVQGKAADAASGGRLIDGKGFLAHELVSSDGSDATDATPMVGQQNAVTDAHHSGVVHNESGLILAGGAKLPGGSAPKQTGEIDAEAGGPKQPGIADEGSRPT